MESICEDLKFATLYTNSDESAHVFADKLYMQTGLSLKVSKKLAGLNKCDVVILTQRLEQQIVREEAVILDESGAYPYRCKNTLEFSLPFGFNTLMPVILDAQTARMDVFADACRDWAAQGDRPPCGAEADWMRFSKRYYTNRTKIS